MTKNIKSIKAYLNWFLYSKLDIFATWVPKKRTPWYDVLWILNLIIIGIPVVVPVKFTRTLWAHWFQPTCFCFFFFFFFLKYFRSIFGISAVWVSFQPGLQLITMIFNFCWGRVFVIVFYTGYKPPEFINLHWPQQINPSRHIH